MQWVEPVPAPEFVMPGPVHQAGRFRLAVSKRTQLGLAELLRIHVLLKRRKKGVDGRDEPGHDGGEALPDIDDICRGGCMVIEQHLNVATTDGIMPTFV